MKHKFNIAVLISGRGSNLAAILSNQGAFKVAAVLSDKTEAFGLEIAKDGGVPVIESYARADFQSRSAQKDRIYSRIRELNPDLVCLAGFMQILEASFVNEFYSRIINIHPSLLPNLPGLDTHRRALEQNLGEHGCTVHFVDTGLDSGPIIAQSKCKVYENDSEEALAARVLKLEHQLYPWVIDGLASGEIWLDKSQRNDRGEVRLTDGRLKQGRMLGFTC